MQKKNLLFTAGEGEILTVRDVVASERKKNFYVSLGIFKGSCITVFMKGRGGVRIKAGKTKLALAGKATDEIICG